MTRSLVEQRGTRTPQVDLLESVGINLAQASPLLSCGNQVEDDPVLDMFTQTCREKKRGTSTEESTASQSHSCSLALLCSESRECQVVEEKVSLAKCHEHNIVCP